MNPKIAAIAFVLASLLLTACWKSGTHLGTTTDEGDTDTDSNNSASPCEPTSITDIHGSGPDNVWAVGEGGCALQFDGQEWTAEIVPAAEFRSVWVASNETVFATSQDSVWRRDQTGWSELFHIALVSLNDVWADEEGTVIVVGEDDETHGGVIAQLNEVGGIVMAPEFAVPPLLSVWASSSQDVWVGGQGNALLHRADGVWKSIPLGYSYDARIDKIQGTPNGAIWFTRGDGVFGGVVHGHMHEDGQFSHEGHFCDGDWVNCTFGKLGITDERTILVPSGVDHSWSGDQLVSWNGIYLWTETESPQLGETLGPTSVFGLPDDLGLLSLEIWGTDEKIFFVTGPTSGKPIIWRCDYSMGPMWDKVWG